LHAAKLLAEGIPGGRGLGDLVVIDVGGSTTDVISIGKQRPANSYTVLRGLPEPYAKRTVEGDLGVRFGLEKIVELAQRDNDFADDELIRYSKSVRETAQLPSSDMEKRLDSQLARIAVGEAFERHVGKVEFLYTPHGEMAFQYGKDLTEIGNVIGTGGPIAFSPDPRKILEVVLYNKDFPHFLKPRHPSFWVDQHYVLYAIGLLAGEFPEKAFHIMQKCLKQV
jgi:uncharacterized protein (TIGR01319 family)